MTDKIVKWSAAKETSPGNVRDYNEDAGMAKTQNRLWVVADGMGGHEAGDVASNMITQALDGVIPDVDFTHYIDQIDDALSSVNQQLRVMARDKYNGRTIGSTVVAMIAYDKYVAYLWAGDSRIYRVRNRQITQLTRDHSEVQNLVDQGLLDAKDAESHPSANVITRAIGASDNLYLSTGIEEIENEDLYILCSDGLYRDISEGELLQLSLSGDPETVCDDLMRVALSREAKDNITIVVTKSTFQNDD